MKTQLMRTTAFQVDDKSSKYSVRKRYAHRKKNNEDLSSSAHFTQVMTMNFICVKGSNPKFNAKKDSMQIKM